MMYQNAVTAGASPASSTAVTLRQEKAVWQVGYQAVVTGTATYNIETSIDGVTFTAVVTGSTATTVGSLTAPCKQVRVTTTAGTGSVTLNVLEIQ